MRAADFRIDALTVRRRSAWGCASDFRFGAPRALAIACMLAMAFAASAQAGTVYRCIGKDGATAYVGQRIKGERCSVAKTFATDAPGRQAIRDPAGDAPSIENSDTASRDIAHEGSFGSGSHDAGLKVPVAPGMADTIHAGVVEDFGDPNAASVAAKLRERGSDFRYVQIGDSHTAADYLTDTLRMRLQARLGDGGIGWAMPMRVPGQRLARVNYDVEGWSLIDSRNATPADYPFGGLIAQVAGDHAVLTIKPRQGDPPQAITAILRQGSHDAPLVLDDADGHRQLVQAPVGDGRWHGVEFSARLPVTILAQHSPDTAIGGWWLRASQPGAIVSAAGINGSEQSHWSRWRADWMADLEPGQPDVIAIEYGTNEAFSRTLDDNMVRADLSSAIDHLRQRFPHAAILILGASESLTAQDGRCGTRSPGLDAVQRIQREVATGKKTLFWDWQRAMGGRCSMKRWIHEGLGRGDGVHFTAAGYAQFGEAIYAGFDKLARRARSGEGGQNAGR